MSLDLFMPHDMCINWNLDLLLAFVISDSVIALSYFTIAFLLLKLVNGKKVSPFVIEHKPIIWLFSFFILACGLTHVLGIISIWIPIYIIESYAKLFTAAISAVTAVTLIRKMIKYAERQK